MKPKPQSVIFAIAGLILAIAIGLTQVQATESNQPDPSTPKLTQVADARLNRRVNEGLEYFRDLAAQQLSLTEELLVTLRNGDLEAVRDAYVEARPPYEEIEVFAASFEQEDSDIDARPYAFAEGEACSEFKGFHRIERFLFRDNDLEAVIPYAEELLVTIRSLMDKLDDPSNFNPSLNAERREIVQASYEFRNALIQARNALEIS